MAIKSSYYHTIAHNFHHRNTETFLCAKSGQSLDVFHNLRLVPITGINFPSFFRLLFILKKTATYYHSLQEWPSSKYRSTISTKENSNSAIFFPLSNTLPSSSYLTNTMQPRFLFSYAKINSKLTNKSFIKT